jgi:hypothetical protein
MNEIKVFVYLAPGKAKIQIVRMSNKVYCQFRLTDGRLLYGHCFNVSQLKAKFQVWARDIHGLTDEESYSLLCDGDFSQKKLVFDSENQFNIYFQSANKKLKDIVIPDLTDIS